MALERQHRVVAHHAGAVVGQPDQLAPAGFDLQPELRRTGVERIFEQFLDDAGRPLHYLPGRDLVGDNVGEDADAAHFARAD